MAEEPTPGVERDGWCLVSAEERHAASPETFLLPPKHARENLLPGDAAKLLFEIERREAGAVVDRGVDRMWVIVKKHVGDTYFGVLDSDPGKADGLTLVPGTLVKFSSAHVVAIERPPPEYVRETYGADFFE